MYNLRHRSRIACLAAFALTLQALFATDLLAAIAVDSGAIRYVTLCTGDGYKRVALNAKNQPANPSHEHEDCPDCVLACGAAAALPSEATPSTLPLARFGKHTPHRDVTITDHQARIPPSRAPPASTRL